MLWVPFPQLSCDLQNPLQVLPKPACPSQLAWNSPSRWKLCPQSPAHAGLPCSSHHTIWLLCCHMCVFCSWKLSSRFLEDIAHIRVQSMHFSERMRLSFPGTQSRSGCTGVEARKLKAVWSFVPIPCGEAISILGALLPQPTAEAGKACRSTKDGPGPQPSLHLESQR